MKNFKHSRKSFNDFLSGGDWIEKRRGTDTLLISRSIIVKKKEVFLVVFVNLALDLFHTVRFYFVCLQ